jgi:hypothetical protein
MILSLFPRYQPVSCDIIGPDAIPSVAVTVLLPPWMKQTSPGLEPLVGRAHV